MDIENQDYTEEEYYVYIDFEGNLTSFETGDPNLDIKIIGIDSANPIMEVNGKTFKGNYEYAYCTNVLFEKDENAPILDPIYEKVPETFYRLIGKTNKKITMKRMFLEKEKKLENNSEDSNNSLQDETLEELKDRLQDNATYEDALNLLLPPGKGPPRKIDSFIPNLNESKQQDKLKFENLEEMVEYVEDCDDNEIRDPDYDPSKEDS